MKRVAFTIVLNGIKHFEHNNFYDTMCENFDTWVIVEGVANNGGSTSWCQNVDQTFHKNFLSVDGTTEFLNDNIRDNVIVIRKQGEAWMSKDEQVNAAMKIIQEKYTECFLWQVDVDEQWSRAVLESAEAKLLANGGKTGCFCCDYFVGPNQQVFGEWGENKSEPYRRLWHWKGELFKTHEPPQLDGRNGPGLLLPERFKHYSYYFSEDVLFKEKYYGGYEGLFDRWKNIQGNKGTIHVSELLGPKIRWSYTNTVIKYTNED